MAVVAKMYVQQITIHAYNKDAKQVMLQCVTRGEDNKSWAAATPSGSVTLNIGNAAAAEQFEIGQEFLITFERAVPA